MFEQDWIDKINFTQVKAELYKPKKCCSDSFLTETEVDKVDITNRRNILTDDFVSDQSQAYISQSLSSNFK